MTAFEKPGEWDVTDVHIQYEHGRNMVGGFARINYFFVHNGGRDPEPRMLVNLDTLGAACVDFQLALNSPLVAVECADEGDVPGR